MMEVEILSKTGTKVIKINRRKAIKEKCLDCSTWVYDEMKNCIHSDCSLYLFRTGQGKQNAKIRAKNIRLFCQWCMNDIAREVGKCVSYFCPLYAYRNVKIDRVVKYNKTKFVSGLFWSDKNKKAYKFRSSYERDVLFILEKSKAVTSWEYEPIKIPYTYEKKNHTYTPDFVVRYYDGGAMQILEVKPEQLQEVPKTLARHLAGYHYADKKRFNFSIWGESEIGQIQKNTNIDNLLDIGKWDPKIVSEMVCS